ncbi:MAG TPA: NYN domain-containing protein [Candidatus Portnoybacteria bacterium]|nr:NYN domain-containing protein [Candidatus Portnoybacteria bacterium]MDD5752158.1 NYN domain-containing protein [Candidatus Portnoybacteria bacterium]HNU96862.1 NYN domain-containing protein [Candidatus Portnoybacteria bacterium]HOZ16446.1 NYN domain-containing protein [Candidatus Portnoybacteria bacterium]HPH52122.1 NYN domain-containing protein [Candidatus Portnoybacteria bacterium]
MSVKCKQCGFENLEIISMGHKKKSNCDVELGVDAVNNAGPNKEFMIFTGDGDFEYLIKDLTENKNVFVYIVSNRSKNTITSKRFSHKLRELFKHQNVKFIDINSWKEIIKK